MWICLTLLSHERRASFSSIGILGNPVPGSPANISLKAKCVLPCRPAKCLRATSQPNSKCIKLSFLTCKTRIIRAFPPLKAVPLCMVYNKCSINGLFRNASISGGAHKHFHGQANHSYSPRLYLVRSFESVTQKP